jgi:hypothetical protein
MINGADKGKVPFNGELGKELRKIWDFIRANQIVPTKGQKVSHTSKGTVVTNPPVSGPTAKQNPIHSAIYAGSATRIKGPILPYCAIDGVSQTTILLPPLHTSFLADADKSTLLDLKGQWLPSGTYIGTHWEWPFDLRSSADVGMERATRFWVVQATDFINVEDFALDWIAIGTGFWRPIT